MAVFEVSTSVLDQLKKSNAVLNSDLWNSIQSIQMRGNEVEDWCCFADVYNGKSLRASGGDDMYIGFLPSLQHVIVVNHVDEGEECYDYSHHEIADTLELALGKTILIDTTDTAKLTSPTRAPVAQDLSYPFLGWKLDNFVKFAWQFDGTEQGIVGTEFVIMDEKTLEDKTVILVTPSEGYDDVETSPRLTARSDFRSSLITLNVKSMGVGGDEPWEEAAEQGGRLIRLYDKENSE
ncbi:uncharacterized protein J4E88_000463 [Alternaria novae-zelandiae]|uniref:uncharacterized protein n=1 Tax=Alternaria novae-zelandiae TaxID=430562 RepID=UPI0020C5836A|nr:uncharacterized protein J4E88_000463 [Alternaria novae-zelandiae]KAI4696288.1 hypothetical protein J4E88_000463 [Alternaria novae-zelandiae]